MNIFAILSLMSVLVNVLMSVFVLFIDPKKPLNKIYAFMALAFSVWGLGQVGYRITGDPERALLYSKASSLGYCFIGSFFVTFMLIFTEKTKRLSNPFIRALLWALPPVFIYLFVRGDLMVKEMIEMPWGYSYIPGNFFWAFAVYIIGMIITGLRLSFKEYRKAASGRKRRQAMLIFSGSFIPVFFGGITDLIFPIAGMHLPELGTISTSVMALFIGYAMVRYRLMASEELGAAEAVVDTMADSVVVVDASLRIVSVNSATCQMLGYTPKELIGRDIDNIFQEGELMFKGKNLESLIRKGEVRNHDTAYQSKNGEFVPVSFSVSVMKGEEGNLVGIVGVARDMRETRKLIYDLLEAKTGLKRTNDQLMKANHELKDMNQVKSDFVSSVSHELRTPLTSIKGYTSIILGEKLGPINDGQKTRLQKINKHTDDLTALINDLLDISRIESGRMGMKVDKVHISKIAQDAVDIVSVQAKEKTVDIDISYDFPEKADYIWADESQIERVFLNLLSNAIKFTPHGGRISIKIANKPDYMQADVADTGIGIKDKDRQRIFDEFYRVDNPENQREKGTGLGLSLTKHIVEAHKGKIWVTSEPDKGSTFSFILPKERRQK